MRKYTLETLATLCEQFSVLHDAMSTVRLSRRELVILSLRKLGHDIMATALHPRQSWEELSRTQQITITVLLAFAVIIGVEKIRVHSQSLKRLGLPVLKPPKGVHAWDYKAMLEHGSRLYPNTPYIISYAGYEYVVYPSLCFDEVKRLSPAKASALSWFTEVFFQGWKFLGRDGSPLHKTLALDLPRALPSRVLQCQEEARVACEATLGRSSEWKPIRLFTTLSRIVVRTNSIGLAGPVLGNDERWQSGVQYLPMVVMVAIYICHSVPKLLRPLVSSIVLLPAKILCWYMTTLVHPEALKAIKMHAEATNEEDEAILLQGVSETQFPMAVWLLRRYLPEERHISQLKRDFILASFHSTPSISATLYCMVSELAIRPAFADELREEISQVMVNGQLPQTQLGELEKLDSFMRESARMNLFQYLILFRKLQQPLQLSVGPPLPAGSFICVDGYHLTTSDTTWKDPGSFDPLRFWKLRQKPQQKARHQFTSIGADSPTWGDGQQVCSGRIYAGYELKVILTNLLKHYEFKLPQGAEKPSRSWMPNGSMAPDMWAKVEIRRRNPSRSI